MTYYVKTSWRYKGGLGYLKIVAENIADAIKIADKNITGQWTCITEHYCNVDHLMCFGVIT